MIEWLLEADRALAAGRLDDAQRTFEQVAANDARNAIAVVGLARVAMARGNVPAARTLIDRALAIDPDNAAARRHTAALPAVRVVASPPAGDPVSSDGMTDRHGTDPTGTLPRDATPRVRDATPPARDTPAHVGGTTPPGGETALLDPVATAGARGGLLRRLLGRDR